jgi:aldehyde:ferredoxin oxidoreductase
MMQPICKINLTTGESSLYEIPALWQREYLGGASLAARLLYDTLTPALDPLSPEAPLLFLNGPLSGTAGPAVGRFVVCGRSPYTGIWGESNCGGFWGVELRKCGFDGLWISGRAPEPVLLWLHDGEVEIRPAAAMRGMETYATQQAVLEALGKPGIGASVAVIGPAGENLVPFALILTDHGRVAGRTGMGALMGSKNLKAVAVRGHGKVPVANAESYQVQRTEANRQLRADPQTVVLRELGTASSAEYFDYLETMPKRYYQAASFPKPIATTGARVAETILDGVSACHACVIACGRVVRLPQADGTKGPRQKGAEYETLIGFGPNLWMNDPVFATQMGEICDRLGMDTISASGTLGLAFHLFDLGRITQADTGGRVLCWGDPAQVADLLFLMGRREGFGKFLAEGSRALGRRFGTEEEAVQVKGLETAFHDPRGASGMALTYATSPIGASHNQSDYFMVDVGQAEEELGIRFMGRRAGAEKAYNVARHQDWRTLFNSLVMCVFSNVPPGMVVNLINAACGLELNLEDVMRIGERGWQLKRVINNRLGIRRRHDTLPAAMQKPYMDRMFDPELAYTPPFDEMLDAYYEARGWDAVTGIPNRQRLEELGLSWVWDDLVQAQSSLDPGKWS